MLDSFSMYRCSLNLVGTPRSRKIDIFQYLIFLPIIATAKIAGLLAEASLKKLLYAFSLQWWQPVLLECDSNLALS